MLLGISDIWILIGYGLAIGLTIACIVYGYLYWNEEGKPDGS